MTNKLKLKIGALEGDSVLDFNSDTFKSFILFMSALCSVINTLLRVTLPSSGLTITSLTVFSVFAVASVVFMIVILIIFAMVKSKGRWFFITSDCVIILGSALYFIGDKLPIILGAYNVQLSCNSSCVQISQTAGKAMVFLALICFRVVPVLMKKWVEIEGKSPDEATNYKILSAAYILHMLALIVDFDAIYSVTWGNSLTPNRTCTSSDLVGSWVSWAILWVIWITFVLIYFFKSSNKGRNLCSDSKLTTSLLSIAIPLVCVGLGMYVLGDNAVPLGCACNGGSSTGCSELVGNQIRSGIMVGTVLCIGSTIAFAVILFVRSN